MTQPEKAPLSRPVHVGRIPPGGTTVEIVADAAEREALARDLDLPAIRSLVGRYRLTGTPRRVTVTGRVTADLDQVCVVTLEPFPVAVDEEVEVAYEEPSGHEEPAEPDQEFEADLDRPDPIVNDRVDLGTLTAEFLALGLDPYPKKPGVVFEAPQEPGAEEASPFAKLAKLGSAPDDPPKD